MAMNVTGCIHTRRWASHEEAKIILEEVEMESRRRERVSGLFHARAQGLKQFLGGVEIDLIAQSPSDIYIAPRTFFGTPAWAFASNGLDANWVVFGEHNKSEFSAHGAPEFAVEQTLGIRLKPQEIVDIVLGKVIIGEAKITSFYTDTHNEYHFIRLLTPSEESVELKVSTTDNGMREIVKYSRDSELIYKVHYSDFWTDGGIPFAHKWTIDAKSPTGNTELVLESRNISINGASFPPEIFSTMPSSSGN